jgi:SAM-dependent methyltransferase
MQALFYHAHHNQDLEDLPFWLDLAKSCGDPILELGCGTGRITLPLILAGCRVTGLDLDRNMLAYHKALADQAGIAAPDLIQADLTNFNLDRQFPLIILPCNTYSTLDPTQRQAALNCIRSHLIPGGIFAASMPNPEWLTEIEDEQEIEIETVFIHPETRNPVQASNEWRREEGLLEICWHYDHLLPDGQVERHSQATRHHLASTDQYLDELTANHFHVDTFGDFDRRPFSSELPYLIFAARLHFNGE